MQLLWDLFGVKISRGSVSNIEGRMSWLLEPGYEEAKQAVDAALIKHIDGTGWRQAGSGRQLWTVATTAVTVFTIVANGTAQTLRAPFGRIKGVLISDRAKAINFWNMKRRQICWAHLYRTFISFSERDVPAGAIGKELVEYCEILIETACSCRPLLPILPRHPRTGGSAMRTISPRPGSWAVLMGTVLAMGCGDRELKPEPIPAVVSLESSDTRAILIDSFQPLHLEDGDGTVFELFQREQLEEAHCLCSQCSSFNCASTGAATFLEISPGATTSLEWDGIALEEVPDGCGDRTCYRPAPLPSAQYTVKIPFDYLEDVKDSLQTSHTGDDGETYWNGISGTLSEEKSTTWTYSGQEAFDFSLP